MRLACLLLAAGRGSRFGGCKQLAPIAGKPMLVHSMDTLAPLFGQDLFTVLGAYRGEIEPVVGGMAHVITNLQWREGLGSSIAAGVRKIESLNRYDGVLIALADQVRLRQSDFSRLREGFDGERPVAAHYSNNAGVPAIFPRRLFGRLERLDGDRGARSILRRVEAELITVPMPMAAHDIDRRDDISETPARLD